MGVGEEYCLAGGGLVLWKIGGSDDGQSRSGSQLLPPPGFSLVRQLCPRY